MGRVALVVVLGFSVLVALVSRSVTGRLSGAVEDSFSYHNKTTAKNIASSSVEVYVRKLKAGTASAGHFTKTMMGGSADITITKLNYPSTTTPDTLRMTTIGSYQKQNDTIVNILIGNLSVSPQPVNGALSVSAGSKLNLATGSTDTITGYNHNLDGSLGGACPDVHGLAYAQSGDVSGTLNAKITGVDAYVPDTAVVAGQPDYQDMINQLIPLADTTISSNTSTSPLTLGTVSSPRITVVNGGLTFHGPTSGAGILIIQPGNGTWQTSSTFSWTGLIFVVGVGTKAQVKFGGTTTIIGGMVMSGTQVKVDMNAGSSSQTIEYSCDAVGLAYGVPKMAGNYMVSDWWE